MKFIYIDIDGSPAGMAFRTNAEVVEIQTGGSFEFDRCFKVVLVPTGPQSIGSKIVPALDAVGLGDGKKTFNLSPNSSFSLCEISKDSELYRDLVEMCSGIQIAQPAPAQKGKILS